MGSVWTEGQSGQPQCVAGEAGASWQYGHWGKGLSGQAQGERKGSGAGQHRWVASGSKCGHAETSLLYLLRAKIKLIILFQPVIKANFGGKHWNTVGKHNAGRVVGKEWWPWNGAGALWAAWSLLMWTQRQQQQLTGWAATHLPSSPAIHQLSGHLTFVSPSSGEPSFNTLLPTFTRKIPAPPGLCCALINYSLCKCTSRRALFTDTVHFPRKGVNDSEGQKMEMCFCKVDFTSQEGMCFSMENHQPNEVI